ncbi:MAG TPA: TolC family protein [Candidatus Angelobacter sp.]|nr:TolC family protein [Candidatus Angelobacter sp.]
MKAFLVFVASLAVVTSAMGQLPGLAPTTPPDDRPRVPQQAAQPLPLPVDAFEGSGTVDKLVPGVLKLSLLEALDRGIKHNLGLLLSQQQTGTARADYWRSLSELLPDVSFRTSEDIQRVNLAAFGIPFTINGSSVVGPFSIFDARPTVSQRLVDLSAKSRINSSAESEKTVKFNVQNARETVVLAVGNQYLLALADAARLETNKAQLATAQAILQQALDMKKAGVAAGIDVLRAQVQMQAQQQRVLAAGSEVQQQRMRLARAIGIPLSQELELTDAVPYAPARQMNLEDALANAYSRRPEYLAAESRVRAANLSLKAAREERLPTVEVDGDYGALGRSPGSSRATYNVAAGLRIPIFQGGRVRADVLDAQTVVNQLQMQLDNLHSKVEFEVRSAALDVKTSSDQVEVARQSIGLAGEQLKQAQDRYSAGVSGSLEVVQSQEAVAGANETYIQALYLNNVAKLELARALGVAEQETRAFLEGRK